MNSLSLRRTLPAAGALSLALALAAALHAGRALGQITPVPSGPYAPQTFTANGVLYGNGTSSIQATIASLGNSVLCGPIGAPSFCSTPSIIQLNGPGSAPLTLLSGANTQPISFLTGAAVLTREQVRIADVATTADYLTLYGNTTGNAGIGPVLVPNGTDAAVGLSLASKGTGSIRFFTNCSFTGDICTASAEQVQIINTAGSTRLLQLTGSAAGNPTIGTNAGGVAIVGTPTNDSAAAGQYGEFITATAAPAAVALTTNTAANVTSVSLTAGDWDCTGTVNFTYGATTSVTNLTGGASQTSATLPTQDLRFDQETAAQVPTGGAVGAYPIPTARELLAGTTTVFLVAQATFTVSTLSAGGTLRCRRMR